jgi:hypothetical protein
LRCFEHESGNVPHRGLFVASINPLAACSSILSCYRRCLTQLLLVLLLPLLLPSPEPGRPNGSGRKGYYIKSPDTLAFRGVGGKDMATLWHMLMIPNRLLFDPSGEYVALRWIYDLKPEHAPLLRIQRTLALAWVARNKSWFVERYGRRLGAEGIKHWLKPENIQMGFHKKPSVGVLHLHVLVGPLTEFGGEPEMLDRWVPLKDVIAVVSADMPVTEENLREYANKVDNAECTVM